MMMSPALRKLAVMAHLTLSIGWAGAVMAFAALAITAVKSSDAPTVRAACIAMSLLTSYVIVPLAITALVTGLVSALGTRWGLFRYYWVVIKLLLTSVALTVLLVQLAPTGTSQAPQPIQPHLSPR